MSDVADLKPESTVHKVARDRHLVSSKLLSNYTCLRCGAKAKHSVNNCPSIESTCYNCSNKGHLAKMCNENCL